MHAFSRCFDSSDLQKSVCADCVLQCSDLNAFERQNKAEGLGMVTEEAPVSLSSQHIHVMI